MRKLIACAALAYGTLLAQTQEVVHQKESEVTAITKHGRKVQTDTAKSTTVSDSNGNSTSHSTTTQTTAKRHHGKWQQQTNTTNSSTTTSHPEE
jgi:hypothetical protein